MTFRTKAPQPDWQDARWPWPIAGTACAILLSLRVCAIDAPANIRLALATVALLAAWRVVARGCESFVTTWRPGRSTLPALAALIALLTSFLVFALHAADRLPAFLLDRRGAPILFDVEAALFGLVGLLNVSTHPPNAEWCGRPAGWTARELLPALGWLVVLGGLAAFASRRPQEELPATIATCLAGLLVIDPFLVPDALRSVHEDAIARLRTSGVRITRGEALERVGDCRVAAISKSGVLDRGSPSIERIGVVDPAESPASILRLAAAAELGVQHPLRATIIHDPRVQGATIPRVKGYQFLPGLGVRANLGGDELLCGSPALLAASGWPEEDVAEWERRTAPARRAGRSTLLVAHRGAVRGWIEVSTAGRPGSATALSSLAAEKLDVLAMSGDDEEILRLVVRPDSEVQLLGGLPIAERAKRVRELAKRGVGVLVVGAPSRHREVLREATVSVAWPDSALDSGGDESPWDAVLEIPRLEAVVRLVRDGRAMRRRRRAFRWTALAYLAGALAVFTGALEPLTGIGPSPVAAGVSFLVSRQAFLVWARECRPDTP